MSGKLVGEVIAASDRLREQGLPERGFHALVAIAEKCHHESRQGSVPWSHIRAGLFGASKRTAERAVNELRRAQLVTVVAKGFKNGHVIRSPIYELTALADDTAVSVSSRLGSDTAVSVSDPLGTDTVVSVSTVLGTAKIGSRYRQTESRYRHPGVVLNGSINGPTNGGPVADAQTVTPEPPRVCPHHPNGTLEKCGPCGTARAANQRWHAERDDRKRQAAEDRAQAIADCHRCEWTGLRETPAGMVRCEHGATA